MASARYVATWVQLLLLPLLLASLLLPSGLGHVDLCPCDAGGHGLLCKPPAARSCCAKQNESQDPCRGCPSLDLASSTSPQLPHAEAAPSFDAAPLARTADRDGEIGDVGASRRARAGEPRPPPGDLRLHLLLGVFRL